MRITRVLRWVTGAVIGTGGSSWLQRKVQQQVRRQVKHQVHKRVASHPVANAVTKAVATPKRVSASIRDAVAVGRDAARQREDELREKFRLDR
jgi:hypothetical protein